MGWCVLTLLFFATRLPAQVVLTGPGLEIRCEESARGAGIAMLNAWADARGRVRAALGLPPPAHTLLELVPDGDTLVARVRTATGAELQPWVAGVALTAEGRMLIRTDAESGALRRVEGILTHELAHLALAAARAEAGRPPVPRWLDEGLAQVAEGRLFREGKPALAMRAFFHTLLDLGELASGFPATEGGSELAYAQAEEFVRWIGHRGAGGVPRFVALLADGADTESALRAYLGMGLEDAQAAFERDLRSDRSWMFGLVVEIGFGAFVAIACVFAVSRFVRRRRVLLDAMDADDAARSTSAEDTAGYPGTDDAAAREVGEARPMRRHNARGFGLRRLKPGEPEPPV